MPVQAAARQPGEAWVLCAVRLWVSAALFWASVYTSVKWDGAFLSPESVRLREAWQSQCPATSTALLRPQDLSPQERRAGILSLSAFYETLKPRYTETGPASQG